MRIFRTVTLAGQVEGPRQDLVKDFQWFAFACPMKRGTE